ncbi:MAG: hypothetical protein QM526_00745 [Alphaproteobacteria bacterium]|nr:hypothetical protein [Alphaproteobacteria bacterium]
MRIKEIEDKVNYDKDFKESNVVGKLTNNPSHAPTDLTQHTQKPEFHFLRLFFFFSIFFLLFSIGIAVFTYYFNIDNSVSAQKVRIATLGPTTINSGEQNEFFIKIINRNPADLINVRMRVEYPPNSYRTADSSKELTVEEVVWGSVIAGSATEEKKISMVHFGIQGEKKEIKYILEYSIRGVSTPLRVEQSQFVVVNSSPVKISSPEFSNSVAGQPTNLSFVISSESYRPLPTVYVYAKYPPGFTPISSTPDFFNVETKNEWLVESLSNTTPVRITVRGLLSGEQNTEQSVFVDAQLNKRSTRALAITPVGQGKSFIKIDKSVLDITAKINNSIDPTIYIPSGKIISGVLTVNNSTNEALTNVTVQVRFDGDGVNLETITAEKGGILDADTGILYWNKDTTPELELINGKESVALQFGFALLEPDFEQKNERVAVSLLVDGIATPVGGEERKFESLVRKSIRSETNLSVLARTLHTTSKLQNAGPIPPQVGQKTSYVLSYVLKNTGNDIKDISMAIPLEYSLAILEEGGSTDSSVYGLKENEWQFKNNTVIIKIPRLAGNGQGAQRYFEIRTSIKPSATQRGKNLALTEKTKVEAVDAFTGVLISKDIPALTTELFDVVPGEPTAVIP